MKNGFKSYTIIWAILLAVYNAVVFLARPFMPGYEVHYDARFWISWIFVIAAFAGNLVCANIAFKAENLKKMFYNLPLITVSRSALITMMIASCIFMLIPNCPAWIAAIVCLLILAFNAIAVVKAKWAAETVEAIDEKVKTKTQFIKLLTADAKGLVFRAGNEQIKADCKKVYEAVRYSDPMSNDALSVVEAKITVKFDELSTAVSNNNPDVVKEISDELIILIRDRNRKCKAMK